METIKHLQQEMRRSALQLAAAVVIFELAALLFAWKQDFQQRDTLLLCLSVAAALLPFGFAAALKIVHTRIGHRMPLANITRAARCALSDKGAELLLVLAGAISLGFYHLLPAINFAQILAIDMLIQLLPLTALAWDKTHTGDHERQPESPYNHLLTHKTIGRFVAFGLLASAVSYGNYLWFFVRHNLSPQYIDPNLPLHQQASTLTFVTLVFCCWLYLLLERADTHKQFFSNYLWSNTRLLAAFAAAFSVLLGIVYTPWLQTVFNTQSLDAVDWLAALLGAGLYLLFRLTQRHTRKHTRRAVLQLHREIHG